MFVVTYEDYNLKQLVKIMYLGLNVFADVIDVI